MTVRKLILCLLVLGAAPVLRAQEQEPADSLIRLLTARKGNLLEKNGKSYRRVTGDVMFLHNNTYLKCDTALWNVDDEYIDAIGNVRIIQEKTVLSGDRLHYIIPRDLAQFRGTLVELRDQDDNRLKTRYLDYNTKDSVATFWNGGSMRDRDGNVIESQRGRFESKRDLFTFIRRVQMFSDSLFVVSDTIDYHSALNLAHFYRNTRGWRGDNYLEADRGWYDRQAEKLYFERDVYVRTPDYEVWCERLHYDRNRAESLLEERVQILDTASRSALLAGRLFYSDREKRALVTDAPVIVSYGAGENGEQDTLYLAMDTLDYRSVRRCDVDSAVVALALKRREQAALDPIGGHSASGGAPASAPGSAPASGSRQASPKQGASAPAGASRTAPPAGSQTRQPVVPDGAGYSPLYQPAGPRLRRQVPDTVALPGRRSAVGDTADAAARDTVPPVVRDTVPPAVRDTAAVPAADSRAAADSAGFRAPADSLAASIPADTLHTDRAAADSVRQAPVPPDTSRVIFLEAYRNVRAYRSDMQLRCDSLSYTGLDSIARLYYDPVLWSEVTNQLTSDSMQLIVRNGTLEKGILQSNAFIVSRQDSLFFNQVKGAEMIGYFREQELYRFDALGGASALFFLAEDSLVTTMNQKESKMMTFRLKDRALQRSKYIEGIKNDFFPIVELTEDQKYFRDFSWRPEERPADRRAITERTLRPSQRKRNVQRFFPRFSETDLYFPGYMDGIMREIAVRDSIKRLPPPQYAAASGSLSDSTAAGRGPDSLKRESAAGSLPADLSRRKDSVSRTGERKDGNAAGTDVRKERRMPRLSLQNRRDTVLYRNLELRLAAWKHCGDTLAVLRDTISRYADSLERSDLRWLKRLERYWTKEERKAGKLFDRLEQRLEKRLERRRRRAEIRERRQTARVPAHLLPASARPVPAESSQPRRGKPAGSGK